MAAVNSDAMVGSSGEPWQRRFDPYSDNGGTIVAVSSRDFAVIASDTRQSVGYSIQSRYQPRCHQLTDEAVIAVQGFMADSNTLVKRLKQRLEWYFHTHAEYPDLKAVARLVQTMLYGKRFFPFYTYVIRACYDTTIHLSCKSCTVAGLDRDGTGAVYSFDPVGSYERESCRAAGSAQSLVQPFLDDQIMKRNHVPEDPDAPAKPYAYRSELPLEQVLGVVTDAFTGATERHIEVGDGLEIYVVKAAEPEGEEPKRRKATLEVISSPLKRD